MITTIIQGNVLVSTATFTSEATANPVNPSTVEFSYITATGGTPTVLTYSGATTPAVGTVVNTGVGVYVAQVDLTSISGVLERKWQSTGTGQAAATGTQTIPALPW